MNKDKELQLSKYLRVVPKPKGFAVYHSLFGGLCIVDQESLRILELFRSPISLNKAVSTLKRHSIEQVKSFMNFFESRHFLVDPALNEYDLVKRKIDYRKEHLYSGQQIGVIQLVVTNLCNFRCDYCFIESIYSSSKRLKLQRSKENKLMTSEMADLAIRQVKEILRKSGRRSLHIQFFGGEPLLNWEVIKFVLDTFGDGKPDDFDISYSIITNGSLINEEIAEYLKKYNVPAVVSVDSPNRRHRPPKNKASTQTIEQSLSILKKHGNRIVFNSVLSEETFDCFNLDIVDLALDYGVMEIGVLLDLRPEFYTNRTARDIVHKLWTLYKYAKEKGVIVTGYWHMIFQQIVAYECFEDRGYKTCSATGCQLSIEPSGEVFACKGSSGYFGHISKPEELLSSKVYQNYAMRAFRNARECEGCEIEGFCSGYCLGPLEKKYKNINVIEIKICEIYKELTRRLIIDVDEDEVDTYVFL